MRSNETPVSNVRDVLEELLRRKQASLESTMAECQRLGNDSTAADYDAGSSELVGKATRLAAEIAELNKFLHGTPAPMTDKEIAPIREAMKSVLSPYFDKANDAAIAALQKRKRGRKRTRRASSASGDLYLDAFGLMLQSREMTLSKAIGKLLGMAQIAKCRETFRVGIRDDVKPVLKKYAPELIERYDSLHPDKASSMGRKKPT